MKRLILAVAALTAIAAAQFPVAGMNSAAAYGQWSVKSVFAVSAGGGQMYLNPSQATAPGFGSFAVVTNGTPLEIVDGANTEVVTPSSVNCPVNSGVQFSCSFTATFANAHGPGVVVTSGTAGLQEAINALLIQGGGTVLIPAGWGGTTANITSASGSATVLIADTRVPRTTYGWNGAGYSALLTEAAGSVIASQVIAGSCTGTATSSATLGLFGAGNLSTTTCTSTTVNLGPAMRAGTLRSLAVTVSTGGVNSSSGVFKVLDNGTATGITCTLGTSTSCSDATHSATTAVGDIITIEFTTQASETLAGVKASVILQ